MSFGTRHARPLPEADLDHYEVVWRPTSEDDWTHVIDVGRETTARV